jgi:hypothetical protein
MNRYTKQVAEKLDYEVDLAAWLPTGDSVISTSATSSPSGLTVGVTGETTSSPKIWLSAGTDDTEYQVTVIVTTNTGRIKEIDFRLKVVNV